VIRSPLAPGSGVPVPDIGPIPHTYQNTPLVIGLGVVAIVGVILFLAQALLAPRRAQAGGKLLVPFVVTTALIVLPLGAMFVLMKTGERAAYDRIDAWVDRADAVREEVKPQLEQWYGVTITDLGTIPVSDEGGYPGPLTLPDGTTARCVIEAAETYVIRCGEGVDVRTYTALPPPPGAGA
jgi:hypothetical protein